MAKYTETYHLCSRCAVTPGDHLKREWGESERQTDRQTDREVAKYTETYHLCSRCAVTRGSLKERVGGE